MLQESVGQKQILRKRAAKSLECAESQHMDRQQNTDDLASSAPGNMAANLQTASGDVVDFNPIQVQKQRKGIRCPASKEDLASTPENNSAPNDLVEWLRNLPAADYTGPDDVQEVLKKP